MVTSIYNEREDKMLILYKGEIIMEFNDDEITLSVKNFDLAKVIEQMNQASKEFGLDFVIRQAQELVVISFKCEDLMWSLPRTADFLLHRRGSGRY